jgi:Ca-activated chloride channel family protein
LLSAWQVGVGRVMTWTSDIGEEWSRDWPSWQRGGEFWAQVVRYALPNPNLGPAQVEVSHSGKQVQVRAILKDESAGNPLNLANVVFSYSDAAGAVHAFPVTQIGPGEYKLEFARPAEGAYRAVLQYTTLSGTAELAAPFAVNYSRELRPQDPKTGLDNLKNWAEMSGGSLVALDAGTAPARVIAQNPGADAAPWLLPLGLLLYWPLEILVRRRWLPWR